eukprot:121423_1
MNHSINNLLWITLFAVLYISSVIGIPQVKFGVSSDGPKCGENGDEESCNHCLSQLGCEDTTNKGPDGCGCTWGTFCFDTGCAPPENNCAEPGHADSCNDCLDEEDCLDAANLGPDGCRCKTLNFPAVCGDATCDPTSDPTVDPTIDPTQMPTTPTSHPSTTPTSNPSITPTSNPSNNPTSNPSITPTNNPSMPSITPT